MPSVTITVNGKPETREVENRTLLVQFLREYLGLTGTHVGCDTTQCGACVIDLDGYSAKSCTMLAVQVNGAKVKTIEGLANGEQLHPMQEAFRENHGLQCGFCTPGFLMLAVNALEKNPDLGGEDLIDLLSSNLCRCTGYANIIKSVEAAAREMRAAKR